MYSIFQHLASSSEMIYVQLFTGFPLLTAGMDFICMNLDWVHWEVRTEYISANQV